MTHAGDPADARDRALGLVGALAPILAEVATPDAVGAAREAAQVLGLDGLERLLAACAPHAGQVWPAELAPALEQAIAENAAGRSVVVTVLCKEDEKVFPMIPAGASAADIIEFGSHEKVKEVEAR